MTRSQTNGAEQKQTTSGERLRRTEGLREALRGPASGNAARAQPERSLRKEQVQSVGGALFLARAALSEPEALAVHLQDVHPGRVSWGGAIPLRGPASGAVLSCPAPIPDNGDQVAPAGDTRTAAAA